MPEENNAELLRALNRAEGWKWRAETAEIQVGVLTREMDALRERLASKPKCPDCQSVGMRHCSDPINCGGVYWPDSMYRALKAELEHLTAAIQLKEKLDECGPPPIS